MTTHDRTRTLGVGLLAALLILTALGPNELAGREEKRDDKTDGPRVITLTKDEETPTNFQHRTGPRGIVRAINTFKEAMPDDHRARIYIEKFLNQNNGRFEDRIARMVMLGPEGKKDGEEHIYEGWHEHSVVARVITWEEGVREGPEKVFGRGPKGRYVRKLIPYENGKIDGTVTTYHPNGKAMAKAPHVDGQQEGVTKMWTPDGKLIQTIPYEDGKRHGTLVEYWPQRGKKKKVVPCEKGKVNGTVHIYYEDGTLKAEMPFKQDSLHGIEKRYDEEGNLERRRYWLDGERVPEGVFEDRYKED
jgi:antitoxin component YwqK of YwqJK toxin-antitoxin module